MAKKLYAHNSFVGGQVDHVLIGKAENTLSYARNVISSLRGELRPRTGTKKIADLSGASVLVPYRYGENDLLCIYGDTTMEIYSYAADGSLQPYYQGTPTEFTQNWTSNATNGYTVSSPTGAVIGNPYADELYKAFNKHTFSRPVRYTNVGAPFGVQNIAADNSYITFESPTDIAIAQVQFVFCRTVSGAPSVPQHWGFKRATVQWSDDGQSWTSVPTDISYAGQTGATITKGTFGVGSSQETEYIIKFNAIPTVNTLHKHWRFWLDEVVVPANSLPAKWSGLYITLSTITELTHTLYETDITANDLQNIKHTQYEHRQKLFVAGHAPKSFEVQNSVVSFKNEWNPGKPDKFFTTIGNPSCGQYFQGRLMVSGGTTSPTTVYGSRFLNETDFQVVSSNGVATDPIEATSNQLKSKIHNLFGGFNAMYALSNDGVSMIDASGNVISAGAINFLLKNKTPASGMTPTVKDEIMLYSSANKKNLYILQFDLIQNKYTVVDISTSVQDYFKVGVKEIHYVENQNRFIYGALEDGQWFGLLLDGQGTIKSFFPFTTKGKIYDMTVVKNDENYKLLMIVQRDGGFVLEEKYTESTFEANDILRDDEELQNQATERLMTEFYMDSVQNVCIKNETVDGFVQLLLSDGRPRIFISSSDKNSAFHDMLDVGSQITITDQTSGKKLLAKILEIGPQHGVNMSDFWIGVSEDSEIQPTSEHKYIVNPMITAQTAKVPTTYPDGTEFEIVGDNQYLDKVVAIDGFITLPKPMDNVYLGLPYEKIGVITEVGNPMNTKTWGSVAVNLQNTQHLMIGAHINKLEHLIEYRPTDSEFNKIQKLFNGVVVKNIADNDDYIKNLILYSDKALPFCVMGLVADGSISDMGGN